MKANVPLYFYVTTYIVAGVWLFYITNLKQPTTTYIVVGVWLFYIMNLNQPTTTYIVVGV
jgi:uncharacterized protein YhhL (DUF1145 family)